jgi:hypothetical protein
MKQLAILCPYTRALVPHGIYEILMRDAVGGIAIWEAEASYVGAEAVHAEFREGRCVLILTVIPKDTAQPITRDLMQLNYRLPMGNQFIFWLAEVDVLHLPWRTQFGE